jgi:hypothetical protein
VSEQGTIRGGLLLHTKARGSGRMVLDGLGSLTIGLTLAGAWDGAALGLHEQIRREPAESTYDGNEQQAIPVRTAHQVTKQGHYRLQRKLSRSSEVALSGAQNAGDGAYHQ